jgi:hypothetical protein
MSIAESEGPKMNKPRQHSLLREGITTGAIGATAVAVWFLLLDTIQGRPLYTPGVLGSALFSLMGPPFSESEGLRVFGYTIFHYAVFSVLGIALVYVVHRSRREPAILAGLLLMFVAFEIGFYGFAALLSEPEILGNIGWYQIAIGNLVATASMGTYLWRTHPLLGRDFAHALSGRE